MCWAERRELKLFTCTNRTLKFNVGDIPSSRYVEQPPYSNPRLTGDISSVRNDNLLRT